jgi:hypothetical protein
VCTLSPTRPPDHNQEAPKESVHHTYVLNKAHGEKHTNRMIIFNRKLRREETARTRHARSNARSTRIFPIPGCCHPRASPASQNHSTHTHTNHNKDKNARNAKLLVAKVSCSSPRSCSARSHDSSWKSVSAGWPSARTAGTEDKGERRRIASWTAEAGPGMRRWGGRW